MSRALPPIVWHEQVGSTNDVAMEAERAGAAHGACWVAEQQSAGRGRRDAGGQRRVWYTPAGVNVAMSVLMRLRMPPTQAASVTLGAAVGVREALEQVCGVQAQVKWPNDLYVGDGKLCGILVEGVVGSSGGIEAAVVGIGVNVNMVEAQVHEELRGAVTSVRMVTGREHDRGALVVAMRRRVVEQIEQVVEHGLGQIMARLRAWDKLDGEPVEFFLDAANGWRAGTGRGLDDQGRLIVEDEAGAQHELCAGEVRWTRRR